MKNYGIMVVDDQDLIEGSFCVSSKLSLIKDAVEREEADLIEDVSAIVTGMSLNAKKTNKVGCLLRLSRKFNRNQIETRAV